MLFGSLFDTFLAGVLELLVIYYLVRGPRKRFPFVLVFCAVEILALSIDTLFSALIGVRNPAYAVIYWGGDMIAHAAILLLTISLIRQGLEHRPERRNAILLLGVAVLCFALFSAYIFHDKHVSRWMTSLSRNLSFCEEMLNLILWSLLIQRRDSDYLLLMVSAGIGVQVTGEAIGHTLRLYTHSRSLVWVPNLLVYVAEILCLCIWIWAFRSARNKQAGLGQPVRTESSGLAT
jgi:hypothetical protein